MLPNARKAGENVLETFMQVCLGMLIKFNSLMPVLAAFIVSKKVKLLQREWLLKAQACCNGM